MKYIQLPFVARFASSSSSNEKIDRKHGTVRVGFAFCLIVLFLVVKHVACQHRTNLITSKLDIFIGSFGINAKESLCSHELSVVVVVVVFVIDGIICDHLPSHRFDRRNSHVSKHTKRNSSLRPAFSNSRTFFNLPQKDFSIHICFFFFRFVLHWPCMVPWHWDCYWFIWHKYQGAFAVMNYPFRVVIIVIWHCCCHLWTVLPGHRLDHRNFIFCTNMHMYLQFATCVILTWICVTLIFYVIQTLFNIYLPNTKWAQVHEDLWT